VFSDVSHKVRNPSIQATSKFATAINHRPCHLQCLIHLNSYLV